MPFVGSTISSIPPPSGESEAMSNIPFMQLWVSDFLGDTQHLSQKEVGSYLLLLMAMFNNKGTLPKDEKRLKRIARGAVSDAVMAFFEDDEQGGITQARLQKECKKAQEKHAARVACGRAGGLANALKNKKPDLAKATVSLKHLPEPEPDTTNVVSIIGGAKAPNRRRRLSEDWQPRKEDLDTLCSEGFSLSEIQDQLRRFRDHWKATGKPMVDWDATFRNWVRRSAEMGARGQGPPGIRRDGMRVALDKLGGNHGPRLGSLSEFLAISSDDTGSPRIDYEENDQGPSNSGSKVDPLGISEGEQSNGC
jgi:uncharacterized protein YdaU (DUF1376 family)